MGEEMELRVDFVLFNTKRSLLMWLRPHHGKYGTMVHNYKNEKKQEAWRHRINLTLVIVE